MVKVHNSLLEASRPVVYSQVLLALLPGEPVQAEKKAILGLHHMFFGSVSKHGTEIDEVGGISDGGRYSYV